MSAPSPGRGDHPDDAFPLVVPMGFEPVSTLRGFSRRIPPPAVRARKLSTCAFASLRNPSSRVVARYAAGPMRGQFVDAVIQVRAATAARSACAYPAWRGPVAVKSRIGRTAPATKPGAAHLVDDLLRAVLSAAARLGPAAFHVGTERGHPAIGREDRAGLSAHRIESR